MDLQQQCPTRPACLGQRCLPAPCKCVQCCVLPHQQLPRASTGLSRSCHILISAGSSWAKMLHSGSNFCRRCCIFLLQILGVFWIRECSWLGGTTGLQMRAAWAGTLCPVSHHTSLPCPGIANPGGSAVPRARPSPGTGCNICDCSFLIAPNEFGDISLSGAHLWL